MEVNLAAIARNARALRDHARVPVIPMIKADAYGLGAVHVARALEALDPLAFGVATVREGTELREEGISRPVIVFTPLGSADMEAARDWRLTPTLGTKEEIAAWSAYDLPWELAVDTGMARAGVPWRDVTGLREIVGAHQPQGAFTHFHSPAIDGTMVEQEIRFREAIAALPVRPRCLHADSSAAIVRRGVSEWDAVRPGIFMYGVGSGTGAQLEPEHVIEVRAPIVDSRWVESGDTVSYDATWTAPSRRRIATLSIGYADGYPRNAGRAGFGIVRGHVVPIVGRVTMDMIMVDVTDAATETGDTVTLIGDSVSGGPPIDVATVAGNADMSPYELLTGLRGRLDRIYVS
jgi:alanine racemase